ncbi:MAG: EAL domain-containing protein [Wenzhouxiangellaceae bacterium]|nr:EAL domain-containing protein [Wenzhouxiangellaceae bacterium]
MPEGAATLNLLAVDDDAATMREVETLLSDPDLRFHFADTTNAFTRTLDAEPVDLGIIHVHSGSVPLLDPLTKALRNREVALIALVDPDPDSAAAAAAAGVDGCARVDDPLGAGRIIGRHLRQIRESRAQGEALRQVRDIHERYNLLLESSSEAIAYLHEGLHIYANPSYLELFGYPAFEDLEGFSILDLLTPTDNGPDLKRLLKSLARGDLPDEPVELGAVRADGSEFRAVAEFAPARFEGERCTQIMIHERLQAAAGSAELEQEIEKLRSHDLLTGLHNRQAFIQTLHDELENADDARHTAVLLASLDDYAGLQGKVGAAATDLLIRQAADIFGEVIDESMLPARLSDYILAARLRFDDRSEVEKLATRLVDNFSGRVLEIHDKSPSITASVGLAISGSQRFSADELLVQAESALREAQRTGGNSYMRYRPAAGAHDSGETEQWTEQLRHALNNQDFRLVRLPITSMEDDEFLINEFETRLRLEGSEEIITPATFQPAAIAAELASEVDRDLVGQVIEWRSANPADGEAASMLVPLSAQSLTDNAFIEWLQQAIDDGRLDGRALILGFREPEVRDSVRELQRAISRFGARGVRFALLGVEPEAARVDLLLKNIDINFLKLDGEITAALRHEGLAREALAGLAEAANEREVRVIAPQVENTSDLAALWQFGITLVQDDFVRDETEEAE